MHFKNYEKHISVLFGSFLTVLMTTASVADTSGGGVGRPVSGQGNDFAGRPGVRLHTAQRAYHHGDPTDYEQYMLEMINAARAEPGAEALRLGIDLNEGLSLGLGLGLIEDTPKQPLAFNPQLIEAARGHSQWMLDHDLFQHDGENQNSAGDRMEAAGYLLSGAWHWGENIAWGGTTGLLDITIHTEERHDSLFLSSGHRANLMEPGFDEIGVGILTGVYTNEKRDWNASMATQNFAKSSSTPGPMILGVVYRDGNFNGAYDPGEGVEGVNVRPNHGDYYATTSASGGYAFPCEAAGTILLTFSGPVLNHAWTESIELSGAENVKVDLPLPMTEPAKPEISGMSVSVDGEVLLEVECDSSVTLSIQWSEDLSQWKEVGRIEMQPGSSEFAHENASSSNLGFYRILPAP